MSEMGKRNWVALLVALATLTAWEHGDFVTARVALGQYEYGMAPMLAPDAAYQALSQPADIEAMSEQEDITANYLDEDMARSLRENAGISLDGSTYSEQPLGPCDFLGKGVNCPPAWYTEQQVRVITRNRARDRGLSREYLPEESATAGTAITATRMTTKSITFDAADGYYTTIGRHLARDSENRDHFGEFTYWGFQSWSQWDRVSGEWMSARDSQNDLYTFGSLFSPFGITANVYDSYVGGFNRANTHYFEYYSQIHNWELNGRIRPRIRKDRLVLQPNGRWRREARPGPYYSFLYGFRVMSIDERSSFQSRGTIYDSTGAGSAVYGNYNVRTGNDLVGLQIGGDMTYQYNKWQWGFRGKAGPMVNSAHHISEIRSGGTDPFAGSFPNDRLAASRSSVACVIEFGVTGKYMITPHFWLTGGYDLMWVTGLALAPEQMKFETDPSTKLNSGGTVFYHGLTAGCEWTF